MHHIALCDASLALELNSDTTSHAARTSIAACQIRAAYCLCLPGLDLAHDSRDAASILGAFLESRTEPRANKRFSLDSTLERGLDHNLRDAHGRLKRLAAVVVPSDFGPFIDDAGIPESVQFIPSHGRDPRDIEAM